MVNYKYDKQFIEYLRYGKPITAQRHSCTYEKKFITAYYIWRTMRDHKVRTTHAANEGVVFEYGNPPPKTGEPGDEINCRCWHEDIFATMGFGIEDNIDMSSTKSWPKPPIDGKLREGTPSRGKPKDRGEKSLYDQYGGEWRVHHQDRYHNTHWDYKSRQKMSMWLNIPINDKRTEKDRYN